MMLTDCIPQRRAGPLQGWALVSSSWLTVIASGALLGPILPRMTEQFRSVPRVDVLIPLVATLPALFVALLAVPFGMLGDRIGHRRLMFWAALVYGILGMAPYWMQSLYAIVVSRGIVGVAEAVITTCVTTLIGHYFRGNSSARWYALQAGSTPIVAIVVIALGGALGESDWHNVFLVYSFGLLVFVLTAFVLWEPQRELVGSAAAQHASVDLHVVNWPRQLGIGIIAVFAFSAFMITVIQTGALLTERGIPSPRTIGLWQSIASLANPLGALLFGLWAAKSHSKLTTSLVLMGIGFCVIALQPSWQAALVGAVITNLGCGLVQPTLITWALVNIPDAARGKVAGAFLSAAFLGQFLSPLSVVWLKGVSGSLSSAVLCYSIACLAVALLTATSRVRSSLAGHLSTT
jgi:MFS family permease